MATQYNTEPQTTAKVILSTTSGELDVELWAGQAPATARAFLQLCLDGFYTNQPFSRLVPGFVVQLGDVDMDSPRRSAASAEEVSSRLKFNRRGLLGAVRRDPTGFFITLESARELDGRATMFGKVVGETVYNVVKMGEAEVNGEVPVFPVKVVETRVVVNPFEDMVARAPPAVEGEGAETEKRDVKKKGGKKKDGKKGKGALLSFGEEEEGGEAEEVKFAKPKFDARLVVDRRVETRAKDAPANSTPPAPIPPPSPSHPVKATPTTTSHQQLPPPTPPKSQSQSQPQPQSNPPPSKSNPPPPPKRSLLAVQKSLLPKTSLPARKRKRTSASASTSDDRTTLAALERFQKKLFTTTNTTTSPTTTPPPPLPPQQKIQTENQTQDDDPYHEPRLCDLHFIPDCLSCTAFEPRDDDDGEDNAADDGRAGIWGHELRFGKDFAGKDLEWRRRRLEETKGL